jgi:hypothetical protein
MTPCGKCVCGAGDADLLLDRGLKRSSAREEVEDKDNDGENQENMDPAAHGVAADESYDPEEEEDNCDCPEHFLLVSSERQHLFLLFAIISGPYGLPVVRCGAWGAGCHVRIKYELSSQE